MEKLGKIIHPKDAKVFMDEQELVREYLHTDTTGTVRVSVSAFNTSGEVERFLKHMARLG